MTTVNISLTEELRAFIDEQIAQGSYNNASEYVHHLISHAQQAYQQARIETMLLEGLDSGEPIDVTDEWDEQYIFMSVPVLPACRFRARFVALVRD